MVQPNRPQVTIQWTYALCMLDNKGYRDTLKICNNYRFSVVTMVTRTRLILCYTYIAYLVVSVIVRHVKVVNNCGCLFFQLNK